MSSVSTSQSVSDASNLEIDRTASLYGEETEEVVEPGPGVVDMEGALFSVGSWIPAS